MDIHFKYCQLHIVKNPRQNTYYDVFSHETGQFLFAIDIEASEGRALLVDAGVWMSDVRWLRQR